MQYGRKRNENAFFLHKYICFTLILPPGLKRAQYGGITLAVPSCSCRPSTTESRLANAGKKIFFSFAERMNFGTILG
jgi:hypothetical protein